MTIGGRSPAGRSRSHVRQIARRRGWDVDVVPVPALLHNRPEQIPGAVAELADELARALRPGRAGLRRLRDLRRARRALGARRACSGEHCYDVFAREEVARRMAAEPGTYFLTDFLARTFEHTVVRELGLDRHPELRDDYFRHYRRVVWLAQRPTPRGRARGAGGGRADRPAAGGARGRRRRARGRARAARGGGVVVSPPVVPWGSQLVAGGSCRSAVFVRPGARPRRGPPARLVPARPDRRRREDSAMLACLLIFGDSALGAGSLGLVGVQLHGERPMAMQVAADWRRARWTECVSRGLNVG